MGLGRVFLLLEVALSLAFPADLWYPIYMMKNEKQQPIFTEKQLNNMSQENMSQIILLMQANQQELEKKQKIMEEKMHELEFMNALLSDKLTLAQKKQFGSSSEKYADGYVQMGLFNEAEQDADLESSEPELEEVCPSAYKRRKKKGKKEEDLSKFPVTETIEHKLEGEESLCSNCGKNLKVVNKEVTRTLKFIPSHFEVIEEITYVYGCPDCGQMVRAAKDTPLLQGSIATSSLVAGVMNAKYVNGMPLDRQRREFARYDLNLSTRTMANWMILCAERFLQPIYDLMVEEFLRSPYIHSDETRIQVLGEPEQNASTQNWMWVYMTDGNSGHPSMSLFRYERTRGGYHPVKFLGDYVGYLTCDGYQPYHGLPERITVTGCFAHARRRFNDCLTIMKKTFTKEQLKETTAYQAMSRIGMLYKIEEMIHDRSPEEKYQERQKQSKPLLEAYFEWLHTLEDAVDRSSKIGDAVLYSLNQEKYLRRYIEDGHLSIDNSACERAIKNFAIGRRNWLFSKSIAGAEASAVIYSITETAMQNGVKPYNYLSYVLEKMKDLGPFPDSAAVRELLPWSPSIPAECKTNTRK